MTQEPVEHPIARLAAKQHGVFSREQAKAFGITKHAIQKRLTWHRWELVHPGVLRIAGSPHSRLQSLMAASLAWGDGAVVSHRAAGGLFDIPGCTVGIIEVTTPHARRRRNVAGVIVHYSALPKKDVTSVGPIPVTTPTRTLIDLAAVVPRDMLEEALDDVLRKGLTSLRRLRSRLDELGRSGRPGIAAIRALLNARDPSSAVSESVMETRLLRIIGRGGLPAPVAQYPIRESSRIVARVDLAYPAARVAIEADGYPWHSGRARWERDRARLNTLTTLGWRVIHVTWKDMTQQPHAVTQRIAAMLELPRAGVHK